MWYGSVQDVCQRHGNESWSRPGVGPVEMGPGVGPVEMGPGVGPVKMGPGVGPVKMGSGVARGACCDPWIPLVSGLLSHRLSMSQTISFSTH